MAPGTPLAAHPRLPLGTPHRGPFGDARPADVAALPLPPHPMPSHWGRRPLKAWRYIGVFGPEVMLCLARVRIGRARQSFWAVWDRRSGTLCERTSLGNGAVRLEPGRASVREGSVELELELEEAAGVETVCPAGQAYAWTRKQGGIEARGHVVIDGRQEVVRGRAIIDDTCAYYPRHTHWRWCAGAGTAADGRSLAWNLVSGVNDPPSGSERTLWVDGEPRELPPCRFTAALDGVDELSFAAEAVRERRENLVLVRSEYRQPFGTFSGRLPGGLQLAEGYGVMEEHDAWW